VRRRMMMRRSTRRAVRMGADGGRERRGGAEGAEVARRTGMKAVVGLNIEEVWDGVCE
jgi:hypothetical protein